VRAGGAGVEPDDGGPGEHQYRHGRAMAHFGEELGMAAAPLGDDVQKGGENVWISRMRIDLG
jgi:hypothetical protein